MRPAPKWSRSDATTRSRSASDARNPRPRPGGLLAAGGLARAAHPRLALLPGRVGLRRDDGPDQGPEDAQQQPRAQADLLPVALALGELAGGDRGGQPEQQQVEGLGADGREDEGGVHGQMVDSTAAVAAWWWLVDGRRRGTKGHSADRHGPLRTVASGAARRGQAGAGVVGSAIYAPR